MCFYLDNDAHFPNCSRRRHCGAGLIQEVQHYKEGGISLAQMPETTGSCVAEKLTPLKRGWLALAAVKEIGPQFLGRYAVAENGDVEVLFGRTGVSMITEFAVGGLQKLEEKYRMGEEVTTADAAIAAVETASMVIAGVGVIRSARNASNIARAGKLGREVRVVQATTVASRTFSSTAKYVLAGVGLYVVSQHPGVVSAAFRALAEALGIPPWLGQLIGWIALICAILSPIGWLLILLAPFLVHGLRLLLGLAEWVIASRTPKCGQS